MSKETIIVPDRDENGYLKGTKAVTVHWHCPKCGKKFQAPEITSFYENDQSYAVHTWTSNCEHQIMYNDLNLVERYYLKEASNPFHADGFIEFYTDCTHEVAMDINAHDMIDLSLTTVQAREIAIRLINIASRAEYNKKSEQQTDE
ncbi:serrate RNA effector molecule-like protein [Bacillus phage vB_BanH_McCartney]|nr:serrate RNA effector molecule-like protein [Bacillus phage vB_BanH_McCartney]